MAFVLMRLFYGIYFLGSAIIFYNFVSQLLFKGERVDSKFAFNQLALVLIWPLALMSQPGREILFKLVRRL